VRAWGLPTNPPKRSDSRTRAFIAEHGTETAELEAIPPTMLRNVVSDAIGRHVSPERIKAAKRDEELQRDALLAVSRVLPTFLQGGNA
jgi:hypothetical protein